jgi:hypothetical protein
MSSIVSGTPDGTVRAEAQLKCHKVVALRTLLYGSECWIITKQQESLRTIVGYRGTDHTRNQANVELNMYNILIKNT